MVDIVDIQKLVERGCNVIVGFGSTNSISYPCGTMFLVQKNWIVYTPPFPSGPEDLHDSLITGLVEHHDGYLYTDQYGRKIVFSPFDGFEMEAKQECKAWRKAIKSSEKIQQDFLDAIEIRRKNPEEFLGGYWVE